MNPPRPQPQTRFLNWQEFLRLHRDSLFRELGSSSFYTLSTRGRTLLQCLFNSINEIFWRNDDEPLHSVLSPQYIIVELSHNGQDYNILSVTLRRIIHKIGCAGENDVNHKSLCKLPKEQSWEKELGLLGHRLDEMFELNQPIDPCLTHLKSLTDLEGIPETLPQNLRFRWNVVLNHPSIWVSRQSSAFIMSLDSLVDRRPGHSESVNDLIRDYHIENDEMRNESISVFLENFFDKSETELVKRFYLDCYKGLEDYYGQDEWNKFLNKTKSMQYLTFMRNVLSPREEKDAKYEMKKIPIIRNGLADNPDKIHETLIDEIFEFGSQLIIDWLIIVLSKSDLDYFWKDCY